MEPTNTDLVIERLRADAKKSRSYAHRGILAVGLYIFLAVCYLLYYSAELDMSLLDKTINFSQKLENNPNIPNNIYSTAKETPLALMAAGDIMASAVGKILASLLSVYLAQLQLSFIRYHLRLSTHLGLVADAYQICRDKLELFPAIFSATSSPVVDFAKTMAAAQSTPVSALLSKAGIGSRNET